jgi:hypothetical protein
MFQMIKQIMSVACTVFMMAAIAAAQSQSASTSLSVEGYPGEATVVRVQGRMFVDVQDLARITDGSLSFEKNSIILTLHHPDAVKYAGENNLKSGFSRDFRRAAIEAMASIREWGGTLMVIVQTGYPVERAIAGNTIEAHQSRAGEAVAMAATVASTDDDNRGLELLKNEFNHVQDWSDRFIKARSSLNAANLTMSESPLTRDDEAQKTIRCGQFLAQLFAGNTFQDDSSCH